MLEDILKLLQVTAIVYPHLMELITVVRTGNGINVSIQAEATEEGFNRTAALVEQWQKEGS